MFTGNTYIEIVENGLNLCTDKKGLIMFDYVIMTNHIHLLLQAKNNNLLDVLQDFKEFTLQRITDAIEAIRKAGNGG